MSLQAEAEKCRAGLDNLEALLSAADSMTNDIPENLGVLQKQALLDSVGTGRFHRRYKEWENQGKADFVEQEIRPYNKKLARLSRLSNDYEHAQLAYDDLRRVTKMPVFAFSTETVAAYENGRLLKTLEIESEHEQLPLIALDKLYTLNPGSQLARPDYHEFSALLKAEYRTRMLLQIKHEVLLKIKSDLMSKNSQWAARDTRLNDFLTKDLAQVHAEIQKVRASEYEDLRYYEDEEEEEEELLEEEESHIEETVAPEDPEEAPQPVPQDLDMAEEPEEKEGDSEPTQELAAAEPELRSPSSRLESPSTGPAHSTEPGQEPPREEHEDIVMAD